MIHENNKNLLNINNENKVKENSEINFINNGKSSEENSPNEIKGLDTELLERAFKLLVLFVKNNREKRYNTPNPFKLQDHQKLIDSIPDEPPKKGISLENLMNEIENDILPLHVDSQNQNFFCKFPQKISHSTLISDFLANAFHGVGFMWNSHPALTELENMVCDWLVDFFNLDPKFYLSNEGGGCLNINSDDCISNSIIVAKFKILRSTPMIDTKPNSKLIGYYTEHNSTYFPQIFAMNDIINYKKIDVVYDENEKNYQISQNFESIIEEDIKNGFIPFFFCCILGSLPTGAFDDVEKITKICKKHNIHIAVNCNWAGNFFCLDEFKTLTKKLYDSNSIIIDLDNMLFGGKYTCLHLVDNKNEVMEAFAGKGSQYNPKSTYISHKYSDIMDVYDYKDWQIGMLKKFSSLKVWFNLQYYGSEGLKSFLRKTIYYADLFEKKLSQDKRFKIHTKSLSLVTFKLLKIDENDSDQKSMSEENKLNTLLLNEINSSESVKIDSGFLQNELFLRVAFTTTGLEDALKEKEEENTDHIDNLIKVIMVSLTSLEKKYKNIS